MRDEEEIGWVEQHYCRQFLEPLAQGHCVATFSAVDGMGEDIIVAISCEVESDVLGAALHSQSDNLRAMACIAIQGMARRQARTEGFNPTPA